MLSFRSRTAETESPTLYAELIRRGLPTDYARRTAEELDDHRADLLADLRAEHADDPEEIANERLGETRALAKRIAADYQRRSWFGRWPLVSFLLLPPVLLIAVWTGLIYGLVGVGQLVNWALGSTAPGEAERNLESAWTFYYVAIGVFSFAVPVALAWWYSRFALVGAQSRAYLLLACLSFGLMSGMVYHQVAIDPANADRASNLIGMMIAEPVTMAQHYLKPMQFAQLMVPIAVGVVLLVRDERRRRGALDSVLRPDDVSRVAA
ncbi:MAG: hypothetical protein AAF266_14010 [Planctomycetota bacterium]